MMNVNQKRTEIALSGVIEKDEFELKFVAGCAWLEGPRKERKG